ncbi:MAG: hypothetical protein VYA51_11725 [Planctomycetota bacterium]|nr:hypothetical protein [Planctomycetota bacterium]
MADTAPPAGDRGHAAVKEAEAALRAGQRALAQVDEALRARPPARAGRARERVLRALLALNVAALLVVSLLPAEQAAVRMTLPTSYQPWGEALHAAEQQDWAAAVTVLEAYLSDGVGLPVSERLSALSALSYYASRGRDQTMSRRFDRAARALVARPGREDDLVRDVEAAMERDDREVLSRAWERFQARATELPPHLFTPVAQSYLADAGGSSQARREWVAQAAALLGAQDSPAEDGK